VSPSPQTRVERQPATACGRSSPQRRRRASGWLAALILGVAASTGHAVAKNPDEVEIGQTLRDATMQGLNGPSRKLSDFRGKPLIINVWASWCGPCRQEMASLERLAWQEHAVPFAVIGISTDDYPENAQRLLKGSNATISHFIDRRLLLEHMLGASRLPLTVLVDANGKVVDKLYGARQWDGPDALTLIGKAFGKRGAAPGR
jgi:thiol-disulfide isomerase/thioredoxin